MVLCQYAWDHCHLPRLLVNGNGRVHHNQNGSFLALGIGQLHTPSFDPLQRRDSFRRTSLGTPKQKRAAAANGYPHHLKHKAINDGARSISSDSYEEIKDEISRRKLLDHEYIVESNESDEEDAPSEDDSSNT